MTSGIKHYIELNSAFRDRIKYPNPAEFVVNFQNGSCENECLSCFSSTNPVSDAYPIYNFQSSDSKKGPFNHEFPVSCSWGGGTSISPILSGYQSFSCEDDGTGPNITFIRTALGDRKNYRFDCPLNKLANDYYNGMEFTLLDVTSNPSKPTFSSKITDYNISKGPECLLAGNKTFYIPSLTIDNNTW